MDTLKPNMYVRTKSKGIVKIDEVIENGVITYEDDFGREWEEQTGRKLIRYISNDGWNCGLDENDILKASNKIIDLIEEGDYVNGCYVSNKRSSVNEHLGGHPKGIGIIKCNAYFNQGNYNDCKFEWIIEKDIKSIVTKEAFKSMEYKVESEVK